MHCSVPGSDLTKTSKIPERKCYNTLRHMHQPGNMLADGCAMSAESLQRQSAWLFAETVCMAHLHPSYCVGAVLSLLFTTAGSLLCVRPGPC